MKYTLWQPLFVNGQHHAVFTKEIETTAVLVAGMEIEGEAWKEPRDVTSVLYNMDDDTSTAYVSVLDVRSEGFARDHETAFLGRGWKKLGAEPTPLAYASTGGN